MLSTGFLLSNSLPANLTTSAQQFGSGIHQQCDSPASPLANTAQAGPHSILRESKSWSSWYKLVRLALVTSRVPVHSFVSHQAGISGLTHLDIASRICRYKSIPASRHGDYDDCPFPLSRLPWEGEGCLILTHPCVPDLTRFSIWPPRHSNQHWRFTARP